jgi:hypothetical protein
VYDIHTDMVITNDQGEITLEEKTDSEGTGCPYHYEFNAEEGKCVLIESKAIRQLSGALIAIAIFIGFLSICAMIYICKRVLTKRHNPVAFTVPSSQVNSANNFHDVESAKNL